MKRIFALIISLMLVTCIFAACGDDDTYRQPGTGTTLGGKVTTPAIDDQNGSYSADPDGEVNQTTDNDNIFEDGMNDLENGIEQGMDDIEQGLDDLGEGAEDMLGGNNADVNNADGMDANGTNGAVLDEDAPEAKTPDEVDYEGIAGPSQPSGLDFEEDSANAAGNNNANNNNNNAGNTNGATNGNSH